MESRRVFRTRTFSRWMRKAGLADEALCRAVVEMAQGLIDADLGGHLVKKRVAQEAAKELLAFDDRQLAIALSAGEIVEVCHGNA